jgi:hypothetical protein
LGNTVYFQDDDNPPLSAPPEGWLAPTDLGVQTRKPLRDQYAPGAPIWLTETAGAASERVTSTRGGDGINSLITPQ